MALTLYTAALRDELSAKDGMQCWVKQHLGAEDTLEICTGRDSLWLLLRRAGAGGVALRLAYAPGIPLRPEVVADSQESNQTVFEVKSSLGLFRVNIRWKDSLEQPLLRCTVRLTPSENTLLPYWPRDLYPLDAGGTDPALAKGEVHAAQRGLNAGLIYLTLEEPAFGSLLYFQNLTALNDYYLQTETKPDGAIGGEWPELGYKMPVSEGKPLRAGVEVTLSDICLAYRSELPPDNRSRASQFLDLLADVYRNIEHPDSEYHDWPHRAEQTLRDLEKSPKVTVNNYGHRYIRPYVNAEYPDSMVQLTVLTPIKEFAVWKRKEIPFGDELRAGVGRFFDKELGAVRRYLPNVGDDKNADEVDSWYLYHPLVNLGRLAREYGDKGARDLFLTSLEYGIKVAHHFKYVWPIQFDIKTLDIIKKERKPGDPGQSDVGGLYAYAMLEAWELTQEKRYLNEACKAIQALKDLEFELEYQSNLTGWGANSCLRLWRITGDPFYLGQSYVFLANFFHNSILWKSEIGTAVHYSTFLSASCLHDGPYMAIYECFESFAAMFEYLEIGGNDLPDAVKLLLTEYGKYALSRAWYYYPEELPKDVLATEIRNGEIDRSLAFPLEDLYPDGQPAGQVGQEVYGCGAAFAFTVRTFHRLEGAPFMIYSEYPLFDLTSVNEENTVPPGQQCATFRVRGAQGFTSRIRLISTGRKRLPVVVASITRDEQEEPLSVLTTEEGHLEFFAPSQTLVNIYWEVRS